MLLFYDTHAYQLHGAGRLVCCGYPLPTKLMQPTGLQASRLARWCGGRSRARAAAARPRARMRGPGGARAGSAPRRGSRRAGQGVTQGSQNPPARRWTRAWRWSSCGTAAATRPRCRPSWGSAWPARRASWPRCTSSAGRTRCWARSSASCPCPRSRWCARLAARLPALCAHGLAFARAHVVCWRAPQSSGLLRRSTPSHAVLSTVCEVAVCQRGVATLVQRTPAPGGVAGAERRVKACAVGLVDGAGAGAADEHLHRRHQPNL